MNNASRHGETIQAVMVHVLAVLFFLLFSVSSYYDVIIFTDLVSALFLSITYLVISVSIALLMFRKGPRFWITSLFFLGMLFFGRVIVDVSERWIQVEREWLFILPVFFVLGAAIWMISRAKILTLQRLLHYLLLLFMVFDVWEAGQLIFVWKKNQTAETIAYTNPPLLSTWQGKTKPTIYFLLFDEYQGNEGLKTLTGFENDSFTQFLKQERFDVFPSPESPYPHTLYDVNALFNLSFLRFQNEDSRESVRKNLFLFHQLRTQNTLIQFLQANNYSVRNLSIFDLPGTPTEVTHTNVMNWFQYKYQTTLPGWLMNKAINTLPNTVQLALKSRFVKMYHYNKEVGEMTLRAVEKTNQPRFIYSHFLIPHPPFLSDDNGQLVQISQVVSPSFYAGKPAFYRAYLHTIHQANKIIREIIEEINRKDPSAMVIVASDHGLRMADGDVDRQQNIQLSIRWPAGMAKPPITSSLNFVNVFRLVLNQLAGQQLPILPTVKTN